MRHTDLPTLQGDGARAAHDGGPVGCGLRDPRAADGHAEMRTGSAAQVPRAPERHHLLQRPSGEGTGETEGGNC